MKLTLCLLVSVFHIITCKSIQDTLSNGKSSLTLLGTLKNGKSFYSDLSVGLVYATNSFDLCHFNGLRAAVIETPEENTYVAQILQGIPNSQFFWIAGTDLYHEGEWTNFVTGRTLNYTNWQNEDLNNLLSNCIYITVSGRWTQTSCSSDTNRPLCEDII